MGGGRGFFFFFFNKVSIFLGVGGGIQDGRHLVVFLSPVNQDSCVRVRGEMGGINTNVRVHKQQACRGCKNFLELAYSKHSVLKNAYNQT